MPRSAPAWMSAATAAGAPPVRPSAAKWSRVQPSLLTAFGSTPGPARWASSARASPAVAAAAACWSSPGAGGLGPRTEVPTLRELEAAQLQLPLMAFCRCPPPPPPPPAPSLLGGGGYPPSGPLGGPRQYGPRDGAQAGAQAGPGRPDGPPDDQVGADPAVPRRAQGRHTGCSLLSDPPLLSPEPWNFRSSWK